jgi:S-disulfanyl-L-cysteine oxidoreductase SoxD
MRCTTHLISKPSFLLPVVLLAACGVAKTQSPTYKLGRTPTEAEVRAWDHVVSSDGKELPPGSGTAVEGAKIYAVKCAYCHGKNLEGVFPFPRLAGGRGTLNTPTPIISIGSYFPFATTIWDFINRAMPRDAEGTLTPNEIYSLTAFILFRNDVIKESDVLDAKALVKVVMPNRDGFYPDPPQSMPKNGTWLPYWNQAKPETEPTAKSAAKPVAK